MAAEQFKIQLLKSAGLRGKTKDELAERLGVGHSYVSRTVNELVASGKLVVTGTYRPSRGRPAPRYGRAS